MTGSAWRRVNRSAVFLAAVLSFSAIDAHAETEAPLIPLVDLFGGSAHMPDPKISQDGSLLAYLANTAADRLLRITPALQPKIPVREFPDPQHCIVSIDWSGSDWLIMQLRPKCTFQAGTEKTQGFTLLAYEVGEKEFQSLGVTSRWRLNIKTSPHRRNTIAVLRDKRDPFTTAIDVVNLATGKRQTHRVPDGVTGTHLDGTLAPRLTTARSADGGFYLRIRESGGKWRLAGTYRNAERDGFKVIGIDAANSGAILLDTLNRPLPVLTRLDLATGTRSVLYEDIQWPVVGAFLDKTGSDLQAVQIHGGRRRWVAIDPAFEAEFRNLDRLGDAEISIISASQDRKIRIVALDSDRSPRRYFVTAASFTKAILLPVETGRPAPSRFAGKRAIAFRARDGVVLTGYLTLPTSGKAIALVQHVHGGPVMRHNWPFDPTTQWLANRGYAVLEINFRGSGGFGAAFQRKGYGQWGKAMQNDLTDAVKWALSEGVAAEGKIGVMGHSYGGYAATMAMTGNPSLYACGVSISGPTDLPAFMATLESFRGRAKTKSQAAFINSQIARYRTELGDSVADLVDVSPLNLANRIDNPILLVHGQADLGVSVSHSQRLFERLQARDHPAALLTFPAEAHVIRRRGNRLAMAAVIERFFANCLDGKSERGNSKHLTSARKYLVATPAFKKLNGGFFDP